MKDALLLDLLKPLATLASGVGKRKRLLIMIYHRVLDEPDVMRPGEVDKVAFSWQMQLLAKHFNVLPLTEAMSRMQANTLPPRAVCISFDDGYADNYTNALPILQQFNLTATFFIASGFLDGGRMWNDTVIEAIRNLKTPTLDLREIDLGEFDTATPTQKCLAAQQVIQKIKHLPFGERGRYVECIAAKSQDLPNGMMLSSEQLKTLHQSGMEIGGHTINHPILAKLDEQSAKREISENKEFLESLLGESLKFFAYPNGKPGADYLQHQIAWVKEAGFLAAVSTQWGVVHSAVDMFQLPRFTPWDANIVKFMARIIWIYGKG